MLAGINIEKEYDEGFYCIESLMEDYFKDMEILLSFYLSTPGLLSGSSVSQMEVKRKSTRGKNIPCMERNFA